MLASKLSSSVGTNSASANYIEDVFSTYLYTGTGAAQSIVNGIDESGEGALTWIKNRSTASEHALFDTNRGVNKALQTQSTAAEFSYAGMLTAFNSNGFSLGTDGVGFVNVSGDNYVSWTFRKQPKFFDVVTWTGDNSDGRFISHSLGSTPGMVIIKNLTSSYNWVVWHKDLANPSKYLVLNSTAATATDIYGPFGSYSAGFTTNASCFTSTGFYVAADARSNLASNDYVAYVFAHDAGGFGLTGTDNVISCGSFTTDGSGNATVNLGYEPQWVLIKYTTNDSWRIFDNMRGMSQTNWAELYPNTSDAEVNRTNQTNLFVRPNATGFTTTWSPQAGNTAIYIAIRRGPMKVPTSGTSVFSPNYASSTTGQQITTGFPVDSQILRYLPSGIGGYWFDRLRGVSTTTTESGQALYPNATTAETTENYTRYFNNTGYQQNSGFAVGTQMIGYSFGRAPSFFDEVCYTGTGSLGNTLTHNLGVTPELMIVKARAGGPSSGAGNWVVYTATTGNTAALYLNDSASVYSGDINYWNNTSPTATQFTVGLYSSVNGSAETYVAYLFATCAGISKVGSYTGTGTTLQVNCGFTGGARFVLIKRTDSTGDWYVWDSARGIVSGNDPYLLLNSTAAQVTNTDYVDTYSAGFEISSTAPAAINASGGSFVFLAIA